MPLLKINRADSGLTFLAIPDGGNAEEEFAKWEAAADPAWLPASYASIDPDALPADRTYRGAWRDSAGEIVIDMTAAREIHRDRLRAFRAPLLAKLDIEYQRADENDDAEAKTEVIARKKALRDITTNAEIDAACTPEELSNAAMSVVAALQ